MAPEEVLQVALDEVGALKGDTLAMSISRVFGAATALEKLSLISKTEAVKWKKKARDKGHARIIDLVFARTKKSKGEDMKLGVYRHYKGHLYLVMGLARQTETDEELVIYVPLYELPCAGLPLQARPKKNWDEPVDGRPRFEFIGDKR